MSFLELSENRKLLGISRDSVSYGAKHSQAIYNKFVSKVIFNPPDDMTRQEIEACKRLLPHVAILKFQPFLKIYFA